MNAKISKFDIMSAKIFKFSHSWCENLTFIVLVYFDISPHGGAAVSHCLMVAAGEGNAIICLYISSF